MPLRADTTGVPYEALPATLPAGAALPVVFTISPAHPSNQLLIERSSSPAHRTRPAQAPLRALPLASDGAAAMAGRAAAQASPTSQRFIATLGPLAVGETAEFRPLLMRSGLCVQALPVRRMVGVAPEPSAAPVLRNHPAASPDPTLPRYPWATEFLGAFNVQLVKPAESFGPTPEGLNVTFYIASGEIHGPRIRAKIRGEGGDWMLVRRDGVGVANVRITYECDDGALLLSRYYGIFDLGPDGYERALRNDYNALPPLVLAPQFITSHPNWLWLNRLQCLAVGRVTMAELRVRFDLYAVRVGQPLPSSGLPREADGPLIGDIH